MYTVSTEMVTVTLLIMTCILGYFVMKISLAVIKAGETAIGIVQAERNTREQRDQRVERPQEHDERTVSKSHLLLFNNSVLHRFAIYLSWKYIKGIRTKYFLCKKCAYFLSIHEPKRLVWLFTLYMFCTFCVKDLFCYETSLRKKSLSRSRGFRNGHRRAKIRTHNCRQKAKYLPPAPPGTRWTNGKWKSFVAV